MKNTILLLFVVYTIQLCNSATVEDAETELKRLRKLATHKLQAASFEYNKISEEVDSAAKAEQDYGHFEIHQKSNNLKTKFNQDHGISHKCRGSRHHLIHQLGESHIADLQRCIDHQRAEIANVLSTQKLALDEQVWSAVYEEEKHIVLCGLDRGCLDGAIKNVKEKIAEVMKVINANISSSRQLKDAQVLLIKSCARRSVGNAGHALDNVPHCSY
ncbi:uncharacterized protein LOC664065 [Tribolium castaneum]|nr:PREDICTED: uncharacterized protein LOC664065 [Tribolium castaneum]|eukprot:XP_976472.1 PREDICTED: uncharacterized protein LOC664065 [Tribolium castaneum]